MLARLGKHDALHLLELLEAVLRLSRLGVLVPEAFDERLHVRDLLLLRVESGLELLHRQLACLEVRRVRSGIDLDDTQVDLGNVVDERLHERPVVADDHDCAVVATQETFEPGDRLQIQVVGRLVEKQHIGLTQQQLREREAHLPASGELRRVA